GDRTPNGRESRPVLRWSRQSVRGHDVTLGRSVLVLKAPPPVGEQTRDPGRCVELLAGSDALAQGRRVATLPLRGFGQMLERDEWEIEPFDLFGREQPPEGGGVAPDRL